MINFSIIKLLINVVELSYNNENKPVKTCGINQFLSLSLLLLFILLLSVPKAFHWRAIVSSGQQNDVSSELFP